MARRKQIFTGQVSDIDLRLMRVFKTVVECGGLSAAQSVLGVGRSTISKQLSDFETRLGLRLCNRGRSGFLLTQQGAKTLEYVNHFLLAAEEFKTRVSIINDEVVGKTSIGMVDYSFSDKKNPLMSTIQKYKKKFPDVKIDLMTGTPNEVEQGVMEGQLHIGIIPGYRKLQGLEYHYLYDEEVGLLCGGNHPIANAIKNKTPFTEEDLYQYELVYRGYYENDKSKDRKEKFPIGTTCQQTEAVLALVQTGLYLAFCPTYCLENMSDEIHEILPERFHYSSPVYLIVRSDRQQALLIKEFINVIKNRSTN